MTRETKSEKGLNLEKVSELLDGKVVCGEDRLQTGVASACASDLLSDVLAFAQPGALLLTGLTNPQVIRTAEMLDIKGIVFVRNKQPEEETLRIARSINLVLIVSPLAMYESCGRLYTAGLDGQRIGARGK